jgi:hypothetical protein
MNPIPRLSDPEFDTPLTLREAFHVLAAFIGQYNARGSQETMLMGADLTLDENGITSDPAQLHDFLASAKAVLDRCGTSTGPKTPITAADIRDGQLLAFLVTCDWEHGRHAAELTVRTRDGEIERFRVTGLREWQAHDDFLAQHIEQCTLVHDASGVYLSLDPHAEGLRTADDNLWLDGEAIERITTLLP